MLFLACNLFFSAAKSSGELQTARSFIILSSFPDDGPTPKPQSLAVVVWRKIEIWFVTRWVEFDWVCLAFCFMQFQVGRFEIPANHVRLQARSQDFSWGGGGGGRLGSEDTKL